MGRAGSEHSPSLALRTAPALDELIALYRPRAERFSWDDPFYASGSCWQAAAEFAELLKRQGIAAEWAEFYVASHRGYGNANGGFEVHAVTVASLSSQGIVSIDWTACQYAIDEFPYLQPWDEQTIEVTDRSTEPIDVNGEELEMDWLDELLAGAST